MNHSTATPLMKGDFHVKRTTTANNSDIDIRAIQLGIIRHVSRVSHGQFINLPTIAWGYVTSDNDPTNSQVI